MSYVMQEVKCWPVPTMEFRQAQHGDAPPVLQQRWYGGYKRVMIDEDTNCPQVVLFDIEEWRDVPVVKL